MLSSRPMSDPQRPQEHAIDVRDPRVAEALQRYWRKNVRVMAACLLVWALAGLGCGVLFADTLNQFSLGGFPLGFWFAQQGSIIVFVLLILIYGLALNKLDTEHHRELERIRTSGSAE
jgi:putative solute:sodium symporter small subunit